MERTISNDIELICYVAHTIGSYRRARGWSIPQLTKLCGLSKAYLYDVERGKANISITSAFMIARAFGVTIDALVYGGKS